MDSVCQLEMKRSDIRPLERKLDYFFLVRKSVWLNH